MILISVATACGSKKETVDLHDQGKPSQASSPSATKADLSRPEGPLQMIFQAAREKNYELYRSAFSDAVPPETLSQQRFVGFVKRVKDGIIEPVPGVETVSDTEAIVKFKNNKRNTERGFRVRKVGDRWLIVGILREPGRNKERKG